MTDDIYRAPPSPGQPGKVITSIPRASDLPTAIAAINQTVSVVNQVTNQGPAVNNLYPQGSRRFGTPTLRQGTQDRHGGKRISETAWREAWRNTEQVRIHNPNDKEQWVQVECITELILQDPNTDQQIYWSGRTRSAASPTGISTGPPGYLPSMQAAGTILPLSRARSSALSM
jgi:DNA/RNA endonuclease YhcR with UshA esterase domain